LKCARELLAAGADTSLENADGLTPLEAAEKFQRPDFVQLLKGHEEAKKSAQ
jgi:ankyrin repeat protein